MSERAPVARWDVGIRRASAAAYVAAAVLAWPPAGASAAVRVCQAPVSSGIASDQVETRARAKAIASWTEKARMAGQRAPSWRIAAQKVLRCARIAKGQYDCVALAQPCSISPKAPSRPAPPGGQGKGPAIET